MSFAIPRVCAGRSATCRRPPASTARRPGARTSSCRAGIQGLSGERLGRRADDLLELFGLGEKADALVRTFSGGQKRRLDVALGLMHQPSVLFLDEPTTGLDPEARAAMWDERSGWHAARV
jgi:ABC-type uncharacterized transport system ATPase subunit